MKRQYDRHGAPVKHDVLAGRDVEMFTPLATLGRLWKPPVDHTGWTIDDLLALTGLEEQND